MRQLERSDAIDKVQALIAAHKLTQQDLFGGTRGAQKIKAIGKVVAKYRDPETGQEWTGRGKAPRWIAGKDRAQFAI